MGTAARAHLRESPVVVTLPLLLLSVPSIGAGWLIGQAVYGDYFGPAIIVGPGHAWIEAMTEEYHGVWSYMAHGVSALPFWLAVAGIATAWYLYLVRPDLPRRIASGFGPLYALVERKYGFDELYSWLFSSGVRLLGTGLWKAGDQAVIDGLVGNGAARAVGWFSKVMRLVQSGMIYRYASAMLIGVVLLIYWFLKR